jgi:hypothetical protein
MRSPTSGTIPTRGAIRCTGRVQRQPRLLLAGLRDQPLRSFTQLIRVLPRCRHDPHPSVGSGASTRPGAVHAAAGRPQSGGQ